MFYTTIVSASPNFLHWLEATIAAHLPDIGGRVRKSGDIYQLSYAKRDSRRLFKFMYYNESVPRLIRKYERYLEIFALDPYARVALNTEQGRVVKW